MSRDMTQKTSHGRTPAVLGESVVGSKHVESDECNQDSWDFKLGEEYLIIAVGDGLGTSPRAAEGSALVTETAVTTLDQWIEGADTLRTSDPEIIDQQLYDAMITSREKVQSLAASEQVSTDKFHTTLSVIVATSDWYAAGVIGDSGVVGVTQKDCFKLVEREDSQYSHTTTSILNEEPILTERFRFGHGERSLQFVAGFSDGLDNFVWNPDDQSTPRTKFFNQLRDFAEATDEFGADARRRFSEFVGSDHFHKYSGDDKTLVIGCVATDTDVDDVSAGGDVSSESEPTQSDSAVAQIQYKDEAFISAVRNGDSPQTAEIEEAVGCSGSTARRRLQKLKDRGILTSLPAGQTYEWNLTDNGKVVR